MNLFPIHPHSQSATQFSLRVRNTSKAARRNTFCTWTFKYSLCILGNHKSEIYSWTARSECAINVRTVMYVCVFYVVDEEFHKQFANSFTHTHTRHNTQEPEFDDSNNKLIFAVTLQRHSRSNSLSDDFFFFCLTPKSEGVVLMFDEFYTRHFSWWWELCFKRTIYLWEGKEPFFFEDWSYWSKHRLACNWI